MTYVNFGVRSGAVRAVLRLQPAVRAVFPFVGPNSYRLEIAAVAGVPRSALSTAASPALSDPVRSPPGPDRVRRSQLVPGEEHVREQSRVAGSRRFDRTPVGPSRSTRRPAHRLPSLVTCSNYARPTPSVAVPLVLGLAAIDALVVAAFIAFGLATHGIDPWTFPVYTARTALPFVLGWLAVAPLAGAYRSRLFASFGRTGIVVIAAWLVATLLGGAIRSTALFPGGAPPEFLLVNAGLGLAFVLPWRLAVTAGHRRWRGRRSPR